MRRVLGKSERLRRLLDAGYFPAELPPPFVTSGFARHRNALWKAWDANALDRYVSRPEFFSIPRIGRSRRRLAIVNPINQFKVGKCIADSWSEIRKHLRGSKVSEFKPIFDSSGDRCFFGVNFPLVEQRVAEILASYPNAVRTDISRYYPTIYTHSISWALYGKQTCKVNLHNNVFMQNFGNKLDRYVRQCQDNQSIGIPVGPDTSRVIAEIVGVALEAEMAPRLTNLNGRALRYVDDMTIGFSLTESPELILSIIERSLSHFELDINVEKTCILGVEEKVAPEWILSLRTFLPSRAKVGQEGIEEFFKAALHLAQENPRDQVMKYALRRSRSFVFDDEAWTYYQHWLLRLVRRHMDCLPIVAQIMIEKRAQGFRIIADQLRRFIEDVVSTGAEVSRVFEVAWALFLAKGLAIVLDRRVLHKVADMNSSVCSLLVFDLAHRKLTTDVLDFNLWSPAYDSAGLTDERWLFVYEATVKGWMQFNPCFVTAHPLFGELIKRRIKFYDVNKNVKRTKVELQESQRHANLSKAIFEHVDDYF
jgi:hypothetical protein